MKRIIWSSILISLLAALPAVTTAKTHFENKSPDRDQDVAYSPSDRPFGVSQSKWQERFTQWWLSIPADHNPMVDPDGRYCGEGQSGPVFYLGSVFIVPGGTVERNCTVRSNKAIYIPVTGSFCSPFTDGTTTPAESLACAQFFTDNSFDVFLEVDGRRIRWEYYRVSTGTFSAYVPAGGILGNAGPVAVTDIVADSYSVMLEPMPAGRHTIHVGGKNNLFPGQFWDLTVKLRVTPADHRDD
jgi:hypothetical protein